MREHAIPEAKGRSEHHDPDGISVTRGLRNELEHGSSIVSKESNKK